MASVLLKRCTGCREYTLQETCPRCGAKAKPNRPAKFSPEDNFGEYRRKLKKLDAAKGAGNSDSERVAGKQAATPPTTKPQMAQMPADAKPAKSSASAAVPSGGARAATPASKPDAGRPGAEAAKPGRRQGF